MLNVTKQTKYMLLLPDGIGIRNFIITSFIDQLIKDGEVIVWHGVPEQLVDPYANKREGKVTWHKLPQHREGKLSLITRRAKQIAQLYWQDEPGTEVILEHKDGRKSTGLRGVRNIFADTLARTFSHSSHQVVFLDLLHRWSVRQNHYFSDYLQFLKKARPDVVFCSHQRSERAVPVMLAAQALKIPTATFIYSWDNLPKGRMAVYADYYLVWSQHMKEEMLKFYPDVQEEQIFITGTPQFEHYFDRITQTRKEFLENLQLNPEKPVICFSGDDFTTSPFDPDYLRDLAEALRQVPEEHRPQILFRRNPTETSGRYDSTLEQYPEIKKSEPAWIALTQNDWSKVVPTANDTTLLVNVVKHCDLVVNVGSTMALDFAIGGKPAVYLAYNPASWTPESRWNIEKVYRYPHFNHMSKFNPVYWVRDRALLKDCVMNALNNPMELQLERERWSRFLVQHPFEKASERCADALRQICVNKDPSLYLSMRQRKPESEI